MNYDDWKLMTPEEDYEARGGWICRFCGARSESECELEDGPEGNCPWEELEPDPDYLMELRREDERMERENPRDGDDF